jgi:hypothetical protein
MAHRASGLNLLVTAIILWNTRYLNRAITALRAIESVPDELCFCLYPTRFRNRTPCPGQS